MKEPDDEPPQQTWLQRLGAWIWGYDFFISYQWESAGRYAVALAEALRSRGFDCFLDRAEFAAGDEWKAEARRALWRTQRLVVIANEQAIKSSEAVAHEIEVFTGLQRRVVPIVFGRRFSDAERAGFPVLARLPATTIEIVEPNPVAEGKPSDDVIDTLRRTYAVTRRRTLRARLVVGSIGVLVCLLTVSIIMGLIVNVARKESERAGAESERARAEERRQRLQAEARQLLTRADLLRETEGRRLAESMSLAVQAYHQMQEAGASVDDPARAIQAALTITPTAIGAPVRPMGSLLDFTMAAHGDRVILRRSTDDTASAGPGAAVVRWDPLAGLRVEDTVAATDDVLGVSESGAVLAIREPASKGRLSVRNVLTGTKLAELEAQGQDYGVVDLADGGTAALVRAGSQLQVWRFGEGVAPAVGHRLEYDPLRSYRISPAGDWVVSEGQHDAGLIAVSPHHKSVALPSISGVGNYLGMQFVSMPDLDGKLADLRVTVTWNANQQVQMTGEYRNDTPHAEGQVWFLTGEERDGRRPPAPAAAPLIRRHSFKLVSSRDGSVFAVLEKDNPLQVMEPVSQASFTLGATAGPARAGMFSPDAQLDTSCGRGLRCWLAAVHEDGTARVWDIESRKELLRIASDQPIRDVAILQLPGEHDGTLGIVTRDASGRLQAWAAEPTRKTVADVVAR